MRSICAPTLQADLDQATIEDWDPVQYKAFFTRDGKQYGLPKYHGALALYYNKDLFDQYHVDYPDESWTHDDYLAAMKRLTHDRDGDGKTDLWGSMMDISWERIQVHVNAWGGHLVDPDDPTRSPDGRAARAAGAGMAARAHVGRQGHGHSAGRAKDEHQPGLCRRAASRWSKMARGHSRTFCPAPTFASASRLFRPARFAARRWPRRMALASMPGRNILRRPGNWSSSSSAKTMAGRWPKRNFSSRRALRSWTIGSAISAPSSRTKPRTWTLPPLPTATSRATRSSPRPLPTWPRPRRIAYAAWEQILTLGQAPVELIKTASRQIEEAQQGLK